jgi:hypothetical protein
MSRLCNEAPGPDAALGGSATAPPARQSRLFNFVRYIDPCAFVLEEGPSAPPMAPAVAGTGRAINPDIS